MVVSMSCEKPAEVACKCSNLDVLAGHSSLGGSDLLPARLTVIKSPGKLTWIPVTGTNCNLTDSKHVCEAVDHSGIDYIEPTTM